MSGQKKIRHIIAFLLSIAALPAHNAGAEDTSGKYEERAKTILNQYLNNNDISAKSAPEVVQKKHMDWPDTSLGCPSPGFYYPQIITPGYKIVLRVNNKNYSVHLSEKKGLVCNKKSATKKAQSKPIKPGKLRLQALINEAILDVSERAKIPQNAVKLISTTPVTWPDNSLGCPAGKKTYEKKPTKGFKLVLEGANKLYSYHSDTIDRMIPCPPYANE